MASCCPVCYRATEEKVRDAREGEKLQKRFFELFERFLNQDKINNEQASGRNQYGVNLLPRAVDGTGLVSCGQCLELMDSFCELFHQLKTTELLIAWKVETLKNVMVCAGNVPSRNANFRNFMKELEVPERVDEVVKARRSLIKNCCQKLRNSFPKLSIEKWIPDEETSPGRSPQSGQTMINKLVDNIDTEGQQIGTPTQIAKPNQCDSRAAEKAHNGNKLPNLVSTPTILEDRLISVTEVKQCPKTTDREVDPQHSNQTNDPDHGQTEDIGLEDIDYMDVDIESDNYMTAVTPPETETQIEDSMLECNDRAEKGHKGKGLPVSSLDDQLTSVAGVELVCPIQGGDNGDGDNDNNDRLSTHISDHGLAQGNDDDIFAASENYGAPPSNTEAEAVALVEGPLVDFKATIKMESTVIEGIPDHDEEVPSITPDSLLLPMESPPGISVVDVVASTSKQVAHQSLKERASRLRSTYRCQNCDKKFSSNERLKGHIQDIHPDDDGGDATRSDIGKIEKDSMCLASSSSDEQDDNPDSTNQAHVIQLSNINIAKTEKLYKWSIIQSQSVKQSYYRLKCADCNGLFRSPQEILAHRRTSKSCSGTYDPSKSVKVQVLVPTKSRTKNQAGDKRIFTTVHATIDLPQAIFVCNLEHCGSVQYSSEDMETHKKLHGSFPCKFCKVKMTFAPRLSMHELQHFKKEKNEKGSKDLHSCPRCDFKGTRRPKYIQHHMTSHLSLTVNQPVCPICKTHSFGLSTDLRDHASHFKNWHDVSNVTIPEDIIHCTVPDCDAYFLFPNQLTEHLAYRHNLRDRRNLKKQETLDKPLTYRSRRVERGGKPWKRGQPHKCKDCGKEYKALRELWSHRVKLHVDPDKVVRCTIPKCEKVFESAKQVAQHIKFARQYHMTLDCPDVQCPKCNKTISGSNPSHLATHLKTHERGERPFCCELCGKAFKGRDNLANHLLAHSGPESWKFQCSTCGQKAMDKYRLAAHMRRHTNEKPYVCQICGLKYADRHNLRFHVNNKHGDVTEDKARKVDNLNQTWTKGVKRKRTRKVEPEVDADERDSDSDTN